MKKTLIKISIISLICGCGAQADRFQNLAEKYNDIEHGVKHPWAAETIPTHISLSGYVKAEGIYDSRQEFTARDGQFLFFPLDRRLDILGRDINKRGDLDQYAIQTRFRIEAFGPDISCAHSRSYIEGDFFGRTDATVDSFRLRHAYLALESDTWNVVAGQTWHPMYLPAEAPDTISFNTGTPIQPYSRNPQFRMVYHNDRFDILGALIGWVGDRPFGPLGPSDKYFRDSMMPDFHLQTRIKLNGPENYIGAGIDYMRLVPRLVSNKDYKEVNPFGNSAAMVYSRFSFDNIIVYSKFTYADDAAIWDMIGGYAVHSVQPNTDIRTYVPLRSISFWSELIYSGDIEPALFVGFVQNIGARKTIIAAIENEQTIYGLGTMINTVFRASPRIRWYLKSLVLGAEVEYTRASYGIPDSHGVPRNTHSVANTRFLCAMYYIF